MNSTWENPTAGADGASQAVGSRMHFAEYRRLVLSDLFRITGRLGKAVLLREILLSTESYQYNFWMRTCAYTERHPLWRFLFYPAARLILRRHTFRMGIDIPFRTRIGPGFYICHFGGIVVNGRAVIGRNCNISHGVTIGQINRGKRMGCPTIGDDVYIGPGAKIIGAVTIGDRVAIGANCVVVDDIPDDAVVVGIPGRVVSDRGSEGYVNRTGYDSFLSH